MENKKCYNCNYLERYYVRGGQRFNKAKCGFCQKSHEVVHTDGSCEKFEHFTPKSKPSSRVKCYLDDLLKEIKLIRNVIEEEYETDENKKLQ